LQSDTRTRETSKPTMADFHFEGVEKLLEVSFFLRRHIYPKKRGFGLGFQFFGYLDLGLVLKFRKSIDIFEKANLKYEKIFLVFWHSLNFFFKTILKKFKKNCESLIRYKL